MNHPEAPIYDQMLRELAGFPISWLREVGVGEELVWLDEIHLVVTAVGPERGWIDLDCTHVEAGANWSARLQLPPGITGDTHAA